MRVLTVFNDYLQAGGERHSVQLIAEGLKGVGIVHELLTVTNDALLEGSGLRRASKLLRNAELERVFTRKIADFSPDIVHVENTFPSVGPALFRVLSVSGTPWVQTIRNYRPTCIAGSHFRSEKNCTDCIGPVGSLPAVVHRCYRQSATATLGALAVRELSTRQASSNPPGATIFTSRFLRDFYLESGRNFPHPEVIGNPISAPNNAAIKPPGGRRWDFAFVGRLEKEKGVDIFLELVAHRPQSSFVIVGDGSMAWKVSEAARRFRNLSYLGELQPLQVRRVFGESRWAVIPSRWNEPFGRTAIEALGCGCIPIVSGSGGLGEIVEDLGTPDLIVSSSKAHDWLDRLDAISSRTGPNRKLDVVQLSSTVQELYGVKEVANQHKKLYQKVLPGNDLQ